MTRSLIARAAVARSASVGDSLDTASAQARAYVLGWLAVEPLTERQIYRRAAERGLSERRVKRALIELICQHRIDFADGGGGFALVPTGTSNPTRRRNRK